MALLKRRLPENVDGDFYVDSTCIDCDLCRQIAPASFARRGEQSAVVRQPADPAEELAALKALVCCPTSSIGAQGHHIAAPAVAAYPERIDGDVYFCGFAAEASYGAASYLIVRPGANVMVDTPRFVRPLAERVAGLGGIHTLFLTHRDDVADQARWHARFGPARVMHADDADAVPDGVERPITGRDPVALDGDTIVLPTPGHTRGHAVLIYRGRYLFSGDHLSASDDGRALVASRATCWYSWSEQIRSVERLLDYPIEWVLPGHGRRAHADAATMRRMLEDCLVRMRAES